MVIIYHLLAAIDTIIYGLASSMFRIIYDIATTDFFKPEQIENVTSRVYIVVGVLMLFKLVISAIQYMINPDSFDDKEKGITGLLKKTAISIGLIVVVPAIFNFMISMQGPIIKTIPSIILGGNATETTDDKSIGFDLSFQVLQGFVKARDGKGGSVGDSGEIHDLWSFQEHVTDDCPAFSLFGIISTDSCQYDYMIIVSTLAGGFLCYILLSMILDIAIRTIKLGIIQMLAPIPISSYVFSKDKLNKFVKTTLTVYTDLFIRMAIVYFIIFAIREMVINNNLINVLSVNKGGVSDTGDWFRGVVVNIAIIFGLLMFAKNAPKFISELLGLPDIGAGDFKDMFTRAGGMFGATVGAGKSLIASRINARHGAMQEAGIDINSDTWKQMSKADKNTQIKDAVKKYNENHPKNTVGQQAFRSGVRAYGSGMYQSFLKNKGFKDTFSGSDRAGQREFDLNKALDENHVSRADYRRELINRRIGINPELDAMNAEIEAAKNSSDKSKAALDYGHGNRGAKFATLRFDDDFVNEHGGAAKNFVVGLDSTGNEMKISLRDMSISGKYSINTIENQLKATIEDKDGRYKNMGLKGQEIISKAQAALDELQGLGDIFTVNTAGRDAAYKAKVGYKDNPAFDRIVQEAKEANIIHSTDTQYGREVWQQAKQDNILYQKQDGTWDIRPDKMGDWLSLNKKMGQKAQTANIAAKGTQAASATIKSIADKYDKK